MDNFTFLSAQILLKRYIAVFSLVILLLLLGYVMTLGQQQRVQDDLALLNLITRQRMFSQKISQNALLLQMAMSQRKRQEATLELADTLTQWQQEEIDLKKMSLRLAFSNQEIGLMFNDLEQHYQIFYEASTLLLRLVANPQTSVQPIHLATEAVLAQDDDYLQVIETLVARYQILVEQRNNTYVQTKLGLLGLTLALLLWETVFIFRPALAEMGEAFKAMQETHNELEALNQQLKLKNTELAHAQEAYRVLVDNSLQGLAIIQGEKNCFINQRLATILGYETTADLLAMSTTEMQVRHTHPHSLAMLEQYRQARLSGKPAPTNYEVEIVTCDQQIKWVEFYVSIITYYGQPVIQLATLDITLRKQAEAKLKENERFLRHLTQSLPGMVSYWTADRYCLFANQAYRGWFGVTPEEMVGLSIETFMGEKLFKQNKPFIEGVLRGEAQSFERTLLKPNGITCHVWVQYLPDIVDDQVRGFFVLATDVTSLKQTQEALRMSELKLRTIFELLPVGVSILDKNYGVVEANPALQEILATSLPELLQGDYRQWHYIHADGSPMELSEFPSGQVIIKQQPVYNVEIGIIKKNNNIVWTLISAAPLPIADLAAVVVTHDITARKAIEEALRASEAKFRSYIDNSPDAVFVTDEKRHNVEVNSAAEKITGYSQAELLTMNIINLLPPEEVENGLRAFSTLQEQGHISLEIPFVDKNGQIKWGAIEAVALSQTRYLGFAKDITLRKQADHEFKQQKQFIESVANLTPNLLYVYDVNKMQPLYLNQNVTHLFGYTCDELMAMGDKIFAKLLHPDDFARVTHSMQQQFLILSDQVVEVECRVLHKDTSIHWIQAREVAFKWDEITHQVSAVLGIAQDITARKMIELELQQRQHYLTMLVDLQKILLAGENTLQWYHYFLPALGEATQAGHLLYFEANPLEEEIFVSLKAEWLQPGMPTILGDNRWQSVSLSIVPLWEQLLIQGNLLSLSIEDGVWFEQELLLAQGAKRALLLPLHVNHQLFGFISLADLDTARVWSQSELDILWMAIASISIYLERLQKEIALQAVNERLERLANLDGLTQIANRRHFDHYLYQEWQRIERIQASLSLLMVDVDHFKLYNDTYGHLMGDSCLRQVAEVMNRSVKHPWDLVARYGGEEFVVILPNTDETAAMHVANKIRQEMVLCQIPHASSPDEPYLTVSIGVSTVMPQPNVTPEMLVSAADLALYEAKQQGRNGIVSRPVA